MVKLQLIQGDCLKVLPTILDESIDLILTDPPYGINYQSARRTDTERFDFITGDKILDSRFLKDCFRVLKNNSAMYLFTRIDVYPKWREEIINAGFTIKSVIVWDRIIHGMGDLNGSYAPVYDLIIYASKGKAILKGNRQQDIIRVKRVDAEKLEHPTQKPVKLLETLINNSTDKDNIVLDCFLGSGSTMLASLKTGRSCIGIEIEPDYTKVAKNRLNWNSSLSDKIEWEFKEFV